MTSPNDAGRRRDDSARFLAPYVDKGIAAILCQPRHRWRGAIGRNTAERTGREGKLGICGEHGGDQPSIAFCEASASLRQRLALSRADRPPCGGASGARRRKGLGPARQGQDFEPLDHPAIFVRRIEKGGACPFERCARECRSGLRKLIAEGLIS